MCASLLNDGDRVFDLEVEVAFGRQPELAAHAFNLGQHRVAKFGTAHAKVTQPEQANVPAFGIGVNADVNARLRLAVQLLQVDSE